MDIDDLEEDIFVILCALAVMLMVIALDEDEESEENSEESTLEDEDTDSSTDEVSSLDKEGVEVTSQLKRTRAASLSSDSGQPGSKKICATDTMVDKMSTVVTKLVQIAQTLDQSKNSHED